MLREPNLDPEGIGGCQGPMPKSEVFEKINFLSQNENFAQTCGVGLYYGVPPSAQKASFGV